MSKIINECHIHSLNGGLAQAEILKQIGDNKYLAKYNGVTCTAIFNPFIGRYYVDDIYGKVREANGRSRESR